MIPDYIEYLIRSEAENLNLEPVPLIIKIKTPEVSLFHYQIQFMQRLNRIIFT